jgi:hypothetical protein
MKLQRSSFLRLAVGVGVLASLGSTAGIAQSETTASATCRLRDNLYTCDRAAFQHVLATAKTAAIETGPTDAVAQQRLKRLVAAMGKTLVPRSEHPDITLLLVPVDPAGVEYNTNNAKLATLRVFAAAGHSGRGNLVWAENYDGDTDLQWPAVVNQLVERFRTRFNIKG